MDISLRGTRYRWLIAGALLLVPLQGSLLDLDILGQTRPDMALVAAYVGGFIFSPLPASFLGFMAGMLTDILSGTAIGINAFPTMLVGMLAASGKRLLFLNRALAHAAMLFVVSCINGLITAFFLVFFYDSYVFTMAMLRVILFQAIYTSLAGTTVIIAVDPLSALVGKIRKWVVKEQADVVSGV